jgi:hypothetical protein
MDDIFWITGSVIEKSEDALVEALKSSGLNPAWIDGMHWITDQQAQPKAYVNGHFPLVFHWPQQGLLTDFLLHDTCRALSMREQNLALIAEEEGSRLHFAVLSSPQAIGRFNLLPRAHIAAWWSLPLVSIKNLPNKLEKSGYDLGCVQWLAGDAGLLEQARGSFPDGRPVAGETITTIGRLNGIIRRLDEEKCSHGLLLSSPENGPLLATLIER